LKEKSKPYSIVFCIIAVGLLLISPELLFAMGGQSYMEAKYIIPPIMIGYVFQFFYTFYVNIEFYHKKQVFIAIGTFSSAMINVALNLLLIPIFGYVAAAYTTLISYFFLFVFHYFIVKKMKKTSWYDIKFFVKIIIMLLTIGALILFVYRYDIIRYAMILAIVIIITIAIIVFKKQLIGAIREKSLKPLVKIFIKNKI
jgi:O-antigen/teichoic acid export membrane protein